MKKRLSVITTIASLLAFSLTSCLNTEELEVIQPQTGDKICFTENGLEEIAQAMTKTTATTSATLVSDGFYVSATTGSAGSESESWTNAHFTKSSDTWIGDKYWPASNPSYHFYASNAQLTFNAAGATVNANSNTDVVCAYLPESNYKTLNTLAFKHIFARLCRIDVAAQTGYTISNINVRITPKVSGTYNLRTGAGQTDGTGWSNTANGTQQTVANATGANNNDIYMVPGQYTFTISWTATASGASTNYTDKSINIPIYGGSTNNLSLVLGSEINFGIDLQDYCNYDYRDNLDYLTFYSPEAQTITIYNSNPATLNKELQYSTNQGQTWTTIISNQSNVSFSCNAGDIIWLKSNNTNPTANANGYITFKFEKDTYVYGNVNSLINNSNTLTGRGFTVLFYDQTHLKTYQNKKISLPATTLTGSCYKNMFRGCKSLTTAPELPATTLASYCYQYMFRDCTSLTTAPELPATTSAISCYDSMFYGCTSLTTAPELPATSLPGSLTTGSHYKSMFYGCTSLTTAPELPATKLGANCYDSMFYGCTSLTTAPELPATSLARNCYSSMFYGCTSLTTAPELPATTLASDCYNSMFSGCKSLTTAPELPATSLATYCYSKMFSGCTSLTTAPELPATTLANNCYSSMFSGCTSLTTAPELPATTLKSSCYGYMFVNCTSLTTAPELPATSLEGSCYFQMFYGCTSLTTAPELPATSLAISCYYLMFRGCKSLTTAPELPATTLADNCYSSMFYGCTSLTTAPELPATTLANNCYNQMFQDCTSLNYIKANFTTTPSTSYTRNWVTNVAPTGTFVKNHNASWDVTGNNGVPTGWTVTNDLRGVENGHEWVDLGLRLNGNKILFATCNVGAERPEEFGTYYSWGAQSKQYYNITNEQVKGYTFNLSSCPWHTGSTYNSGWLKYIPLNKPSYWGGSGSPDNKFFLDEEDDIAHIMWGGQWRMPTEEELQLLIDESYVSLYFDSGTSCLKITGKGEYEDSYIFLPAAGYLDDSDRFDVGNYGNYWSRSIYGDDPSRAWFLYFEGDYWDVFNNFRCDGRSVRPVLVLDDPNTDFGDPGRDE